MDDAKTIGSLLTAVRESSLNDDCDWFLRDLIRDVISIGVEMGVTLTTGGTAITGTLISGKTYFKELGAQFESISQSPDDVSLVLSNWASRYVALYEGEENAGAAIGFVHLRNVRFFAPGQAPHAMSTKVLWRGRLAAIDGFIVGEMS